MAREVGVELPQRERRRALVLFRDLARHLPRPEEVVADDDPAGAQLGERQVEVAAVLLLDGVEEEEVEGAGDLRNRLERRGEDHLDPQGESLAVEELARRRLAIL